MKSQHDGKQRKHPPRASAGRQARSRTRFLDVSCALLARFFRDASFQALMRSTCGESCSVSGSLTSAGFMLTKRVHDLILAGKEDPLVPCKSGPFERCLHHVNG
eukprot:s333_g2.t1